MDWMMWLSMGVFNLLIGGFITVLVYRLPLMLHLQWRSEESVFVVDRNKLATPFNLLLPASHCPECKRTLNFFYRLPLCAYLFLKGKCAYCGRKIHFRYLLIEMITLVCSIVVAYRFGWSIQMFAALILTWGLIALGSIDFEHGLLPDVLVLPLLWLGLGLNVFHLFVAPEAAILGAIVAYLSLRIVAKAYQCLTQREGMGQGDFKCFALLGAWLGIQTLINILLIASLLGSLVGVVLLVKGKNHLQKMMPFGPYLAIAGWLVLLNTESLSFL
jgi:leader peptidase (prepilin peptidase)/N-methyltransferase